jgi:hypothetical protein
MYLKKTEIKMAAPTLGEMDHGYLTTKDTRRKAERKEEFRC